MVATITEVVRPRDNEILDATRQLFEDAARPDRLDHLRHELVTIEREQAQFMEAIARSTHPIPILMERLQATETRRLAVTTRLAQTAQRPAWRDLEQRMRERLSEWRHLVSGNVAKAREGFRKGLVSPLIFTPCVDHGYRALRFEGRIGLHAVFGGELVTSLTKMASLNGTDRCDGPDFRRILEAA